MLIGFHFVFPLYVNLCLSCITDACLRFPPAWNAGKNVFTACFCSISLTDLISVERPPLTQPPRPLPLPPTVTQPLLIRSHISLAAPSAHLRLPRPLRTSEVCFSVPIITFLKTAHVRPADWARLYSHGMPNIVARGDKSLSSSRKIWGWFFRKNLTLQKQTHRAVVMDVTSPARATTAAMADKPFFLKKKICVCQQRRDEAWKNEMWMIKTKILQSSFADHFPFFFFLTSFSVSIWTFHMLPCVWRV